MALTACPTCTTEISTNTKSCPKCGEAVNRWYSSIGWTIFWVLCFLPVGIYGLFKRGNKVAGWVFLAVALIPVFSTIATAEPAPPITDQYKAIHAKYNLPQIQEMVQTLKDQYNVDAGLVANEGFTWKQASSALDMLTTKVSNCWERDFLATATNKDINKVLKAYKSGKTQFISKQVPAINNSMNVCTKKTKQYMAESVNYIIANN